MDQQGHGQPPAIGIPGNAGQYPLGAMSYPPNQMIGAPSSVHVGAQLSQNQLAYQLINTQQLHQQLQDFWTKQYREIEKVTDFKNHNLPLARIKKIMKADEDVRMISAEAPVIFARACEMFILELTLRAWNHTEENKRRTLQKNDIAAAITRTDIFDFLVDIVPKEEYKDEVLSSIQRGSLPVGGSGEMLPYQYNTPMPHLTQAGAPATMMMDSSMYPQQPYPYMPQVHPMLPQPSQEDQSPSDSGF